MRSRRRKSSPFRSFTLWSICLGLVGWGVYQADQFRRALPDSFQTSTPEMAISSDTVTAADPSEGSPDSPAALAPFDLRPAIDDDRATLPENLALIDEPHYPTFDPALSAEDLAVQGMQLLDSGQIVAGRFALNDALARSPSDDSTPRAGQLRALLSNLNLPVFLGSAVLPDDPAARLIDIQQDDTFVGIAHAYGLPAALLPILNPSLHAHNLKPQTGVKIVQGPFHATIVKHDHRLDLFARDLYITSLPVDFPEGNYLPRGDYQVSSAGKLQAGTGATSRMWIGFHGIEEATEQVASGWIYGSAGPRGHTTRDLATGMRLADADLQMLFVTLTENRSRVRVEP
jgi:hypothetical protein